MSVITFEIVFVILLILANGLFSMSETAIISARKERLQHKANQGDTKSRTALELANAPNRFLSTVQVGITLVGILAGAFGGATIAKQLAAPLNRLSLLSPYSEAISIGIVVLGITYLSVVLGELVPKRLALYKPERIAAAIAIPMHTLSAMVSPLISVLSASTDMVLGMFGMRQSKDLAVTEEEIRILIEQGTQAGAFDAREHELIVRAFRFGNRQVSALMTPRMDIVWLDLDDTPEVIYQRLIASGHNLIPVGQGSLDNLLGVVQAREVLAQCLTGHSWDLKALLQEPLIVPESIPAFKVLDSFRQSGQHLALVIDEYGGTQGLVTLIDILEALVGDMPTVAETFKPQAAQRQDGSWLVDGMLLIDEFKEIFHLEQLPSEDRFGFQTVGGFVMSQMRTIPCEGQHFEWHSLRFEVVDMDGRRVDKVLVTPIGGNVHQLLWR